MGPGEENGIPDSEENEIMHNVRVHLQKKKKLEYAEQTNKWGGKACTDGSKSSDGIVLHRKTVCGVVDDQKINKSKKKDFIGYIRGRRASSQDRKEFPR